SNRAGAALALAVLVLAPLAAQVAAHAGNVLPWATLQFGGIALILWFAVLRSRRGALAFNCGFVILAYALAKLLELNDHQVYALTGQFVSGHTLKHVAASFAAGPVIAALWPLGGSIIAALWPLGGSRQNAAGAIGTAGKRARRAGHA
ncbi:MAG: hypothetical protein K0R89_3617, partial [Ramlibacter sp.]|nr:hypothetical protein [Ramlibacter sp.]